MMRSTVCIATDVVWPVSVRVGRVALRDAWLTSWPLYVQTVRFKNLTSVSVSCQAKVSDYD